MTVPAADPGGTAQGRPSAGPREVAVGVVGKPFGLAGAVFVHPDADLGESFAPGLRLEARGRGPTRMLEVADSFIHRGRQVVRFVEAEDREGAEALRAALLWRPVAPDDLAEGGWWVDELRGRPVVDPRGAALGEVTGARDGAAHDYLLVRLAADGRTVLVPAVPELVRRSGDALVLDAPEGLLDLEG